MPRDHSRKQGGAAKDMNMLQVKPATAQWKAILRASGALFFLVPFLVNAAFAQMEPGPLPVRQASTAMDSMLYEYEADRVVDDIATGRVVFTGNVVLKYPRCGTARGTHRSSPGGAASGGRGASGLHRQENHWYA